MTYDILKEVEDYTVMIEHADCHFEIADIRE